MTIKQYVLDALGKFWTKLKSTYVTNCASTSNNLALAASQGKVLQDQITALNSRLMFNLPTNSDFNSITTPGIYRLTYGYTYLNAPPDFTIATGILIANTNGNDQQIQVLYSARISSAYIRHRYGATWTAWELLPTRTEVNALNSKTITTITAASGITFIGQVLVKRGNTVVCRFWLSSSQLTNNNYTVVGTVPSGFEPPTEVNVPVVLSANDGTVGYARLLQNGTLSVYKRGNATDITAYVYFVYVTN